MSERERTGEPSRRAFLRKAAGGLPGAALAGSLGLGACGGEGVEAPTADRAGSPGPERVALPEEPLRAMAEVVLPTGALGSAGTETAVSAFLAWVEGFEPAAELDHGYLTGELRYGPPHPGPRWAAQLEAMELESLRRSGIALAERPEGELREIVEEAMRGDAAAGLPSNPAGADHVAVGLLAWFYGTSEANDLCYRAEVGRHLCRGTASLPEPPRSRGDG
jgi:hypothetical protein